MIFLFLSISENGASKFLLIFTVVVIICTLVFLYRSAQRTKFLKKLYVVDALPENLKIRIKAIGNGSFTAVPTDLTQEAQLMLHKGMIVVLGKQEIEEGKEYIVTSQEGVNHLVPC